MPPKNNLSRKIKVAQQVKHFAVPLPDPVVDRYAEQAEQVNADIASVLSDRLVTCQEHTAEKPLYFTDDDRRELERLLDANFSTPAQVIQRLRSIMTVVKISANEDIEDIVLSPDKLYRLAERARMAAISITQLAKRISERGIDQEIGMF